MADHPHPTVNTAESNIAKFQNLLRELFQFDCADLDFGIYRIMNHKRDAIETFITEQLPGTVATELNRGPLAQRIQTEAALEQARQRVEAALGTDAMDADGQLADAYRDTPLGRRYLEAQAQAADGSRNRIAIEADVYNHLHTFFSRYYQDGDFISKRRYARNPRYAIPYNGEEVHLHWANRDQYYVKTAEHFYNYDWKTPGGVAVHFRLKTADVEQNNVKGDRRFFLPRIAETGWEVATRAVTIPFDYRPLTSSEQVRYGSRNQQESIITASRDAIPKQLPNAPEALAALTGERRRNGKNEPVSHLEHHLRQYTRRNDSDFFIHKDLSGFLSRELDFYLKNDVLNLDDVANAGLNMAEGWFQQMRLIKAVGSQIIDFLAQIEGFQKMLWEKRKFVTEAQYCIALGSIDPFFYPGIADNTAQWAEWRQLYDIDGSDRSAAFLQAHPTLMVDTAHFDTAFSDRLLASFDDLDGLTDGLLVHGENWQASSLLRERYSGQVKCIHIDPPYNTQTSSFLYKNGYQHSSWLAMIQDRIVAGDPLMNPFGILLCHIDENEYEKLYMMLESVGIPDVGTIIWDKRNPMTGGGGIATQHEYIICRSRSDGEIRLRNVNSQLILNRARELVSRDVGVSERTRTEFSRWVSSNDRLTGGEKAYRYLDDAGRVYSSVSLRAPEPRTDRKFFEPLLHPMTGKPCAVPPNGFSRTPETLKSMVERGEVLFGDDETTQPRQKRFLMEESRRQLSSVIQDATRGKTVLDAQGLENFPYSHSVSFYEELLGATANGSDDVILDYFAGSGTTGHAVINLNREDGGQRKFLLVEMGEYFDTVLLPRIKKATFSPAWKDGKPRRAATAEEAERSPRIVKYVRLESYEDALDSIEFDDAGGQLRLQERFDDYLLTYMPHWETRDSATLLNVSRLTRPFTYRLRVHVNGDKQERTVDLPETFNYLLGLNVRTRRTHDDGGRRYLVYRGETRERPGHPVAVIWRETDDWAAQDFRRDRQFVIERQMAEDGDMVYVNGDSCIPSAKAIEPMFKARMFAGVNA